MADHSASDKSICYSIRLGGSLDLKWSEWFDGFKITYQEEDTILTGFVRDQAALHGLMNKIRDLGLPIIYVQRQEPERSR